jgi:hypothetical protein
VVLDQTGSASLAANGAAVMPQPRPRPLLSPCTAPAGTGPFEHLANPVNHVTVPIPPKALADHVSGCAGVRFRIDPDGTPRDVVALTEYPLGSGFAHTAELAVADFRWPARDDRAWRYLIINMHQNGAS